MKDLMNILNSAPEQIGRNKFVPSPTEIRNKYQKEVNDLILNPRSKFRTNTVEEALPLDEQKIQALCKKQKQFKTANKIIKFAVGFVFVYFLVVGALAGITATAVLASLPLIPICLAIGAYVKIKTSLFTVQKHVHVSKNFEDFMVENFDSYYRFDVRLHGIYSRWKNEVKALSNKIQFARKEAALNL